MSSKSYREKEDNVEKRDISRRSFLQGAAAGAIAAGVTGVGLSGCTPGSASTQAADVTVTSAMVTDKKMVSLNPQNYDYTANSITDFSKSKLFSEWRLGPLTLHHRMVKSSAFQLAFLRANPDEYINYYARMAEGGVEMIWVEDFANMWEVTASPFKQDYEKYDVKGLLEAIHSNGAYAGYQFDTMGSAIGPLTYTENFLGNYSTDEVKQWEQAIIGIGKRLHDDGFDAYELNFAANNVGQTFLSRARNNRTDEYGPQSIESRTRFATEVIKGVKDACGKDFIVQVLINGIEGNDVTLGDSDLYNSVEEVKAIAKKLEEAGADSIEVRLGPAGTHIAQFASELFFAPRGFEGATGHGSQYDFSKHYQGMLRADHSGCGLMIDVASEIRSAVSIPVGAATYMDPAQAPDYFEAAIAEGKIDFLVMNRPLCVDPDYVNKLREGRIDDIAPCTRCLHCFYDPDKADTLLEHCRVNAANWRAYNEAMPEGWNPRPASGDKKVMVIGGGPAGMEAARIAAQRGYAVTLYEKNAKLGGLLASAEAIKGPHENLGRLQTYLSTEQVEKGVTVVTGKEVDRAFIEQEKPDVVVLATGGKRTTLGLASTDTTRVLSFDELISGEPGQDIVIAGSNAQAVDTAIYLMSQGRNVTIVTPDPMTDFEKGHSVNMREFIQTAFNGHGGRIWPEADISKVGNGELVFMSAAGVEVTIPCDDLVEMMDMVPDTSLIDGLSGIETYAVGDCKDPFNIAEAIAAGNLVARAI